MDKKLYCRDLGLDCDFLACAKTEEEVLSKAGQHVLAIHSIKGFLKDSYNKAQTAIREGHCDHGDTEETVSEECGECYEGRSDCAEECCC